jgi:RNA polymerase sigma-70 factor (ECF subfamily)
MMEVMEGETFTAHRPLLLGLAYRMLGSHAEAEDVVQEAFLRWHAAPQSAVTTPRAYLATVVTHLCLDQLKSARARREEYVGPWLPEPVLTDLDALVPAASADSSVTLGERQTLSLAFLVLLERLSPLERAAYLLHEVFDYSHAEVGEILGKEEATCRQLYHRAQQHLAKGRPRFAPSREEHARLLMTFLEAMGRGDLTGMRALLSTEATAWSDGGGKVNAARKPVHGADAVARLFVGLSRKAQGLPLEYTFAEVNGWPGLIIRQNSRPFMVLSCESDGQRIHGVYVIVNPDKLRLATLPAPATPPR